ATITTFSDIRIDMGTGDMTMFALIPAKGIPSTAPQDPASAQTQAPPSPSQQITKVSGTQAYSTPPAMRDITTLTGPERESIESACMGARLNQGAAAYNQCVQSQLTELRKGPTRPDLSALSGPERESIESACLGFKLNQGPAAYNECLQGQMAQ